jgi:hypothetical protein
MLLLKLLPISKIIYNYPTLLSDCEQTNFQYFFECLNLNTYRQKLFQSLNNFKITLNTPLFRNPDIPDTDNATIIKHVHIFISETKLFLL